MVAPALGAGDLINAFTVVKALVTRTPWVLPAMAVNHAVPISTRNRVMAVTIVFALAFFA